MKRVFVEEFWICIGAAILGGIAALITYGITSHGDTAATFGICVWLLLWLGIVFIDPADFFS